MPYVARKSLLKRRLKEAKRTQIALAKWPRVSRQRVNDWANNRRPIPFNTQKDIAEFCGCSIDDLWEWEWVPQADDNRDMDE
jgi:transcriptional regulator with XRE-family HTH domain